MSLTNIAGFNSKVVCFPDDRTLVGWQGAVVALGNFDGMHRGHSAILGNVRRRAEERRAHAVRVADAQRVRAAAAGQGHGAHGDRADPGRERGAGRGPAVVETETDDR